MNNSLAVFTLRRIVKQEQPILYVTHDIDGAWQFLDGDQVSIEQAMIVRLDEIIDMDPTLIDIMNLGIGMKATRNKKGDPWLRKFIPIDDVS